MFHLKMEPYYRRQQKDVTTIQQRQTKLFIQSIQTNTTILLNVDNKFQHLESVLLLVSLDEYGIQRICFVFYLNINCVDKFLFINEAFNHIIIYFPIKSNMKFFSLSCMTPIIFNLFLSGSKNRSIWRVLSPRSNTSVAYFAQISREFGGLRANQLLSTYDTLVTNPGNAYNKHTNYYVPLLRPRLHGLCAFCYTAFASGVHVTGETGDYGETTVKLIHNDDYTGSIHVDTESN